jgi:hypothetical protein
MYIHIICIPGYLWYTDPFYHPIGQGDGRWSMTPPCRSSGKCTNWSSIGIATGCSMGVTDIDRLVVLEWKQPTSNNYIFDGWSCLTRCLTLRKNSKSHPIPIAIPWIVSCKCLPNFSHHSTAPGVFVNSKALSSRVFYCFQRNTHLSANWDRSGKNHSFLKKMLLKW